LESGYPSPPFTLSDNRSFSATPEAYANELLLWFFGIRFALQFKRQPMARNAGLVVGLDWRLLMRLSPAAATAS
jgi:hypothetical protein